MFFDEKEVAFLCKRKKMALHLFCESIQYLLYQIFEQQQIYQINNSCL